MAFEPRTREKMISPSHDFAGCVDRPIGGISEMDYRRIISVRLATLRRRSDDLGLLWELSVMEL
jgi:hypothetical protein